MSEERVRLGIITGAQGLRGQVRIRALTDEPETLQDYAPFTDGKGTPLPLTLTGSQGNVLIGKIEGISDRNAAEKLVGTEIFTCITSLPGLEENEYYAFALVGLSVIDENGEAIGIVRGVHDFGAGDLLEVHFNNGSTELYPFTSAFFGLVDKEGRSIRFYPPELL